MRNAQSLQPTRSARNRIPGPLPRQFLIPLLLTAAACGPEMRGQPVLEPLFEPASEGAVLCRHQAQVGVVLNPGSTVATRPVGAADGLIRGSICQPDGLPIRGELELFDDSGEALGRLRLDRDAQWSELEFAVEAGDLSRAARIRFVGDEDQRVVLTSARWISQVSRATTPPNEPPLRVILVSIDTLRADVLDHPEHA